MTTHKEQERNILEEVQSFYNRYQKILIGVALAIVLGVAAYLYKDYRENKQEEEALPLMSYPQEYFRIDSFSLALNGDGANPGFLDIIDEYPASSTANLANYYAGISYLKLGDVQSAIDYLDDFSPGTDLLAARKYELLGHAYSQLGESDKAAKYYERAAHTVEHDFFTPYYLQLAGDYYLNLGKYEKARDMYQEIEKKYPLSAQGREVEKYLKLVDTKLKYS